MKSNYVVTISFILFLFSCAVSIFFEIADKIEKDSIIEIQLKQSVENSYIIQDDGLTL